MRAERQTVDLTAYPELVVIYLGMRVRRPRGLLTLFGLGPQIQKSWKAKPDGLKFSARHRAGRHEEALTVAPVIAEQAFYDPATTTGKDPT